MFTCSTCKKSIDINLWIKTGQKNCICDYEIFPELSEKDQQALEECINEILKRVGA